MFVQLNSIFVVNCQSLTSALLSINAAFPAILDAYMFNKSGIFSEHIAKLQLFSCMHFIQNTADYIVQWVVTLMEAIASYCCVISHKLW